jgi:hypothetical protein
MVVVVHGKHPAPSHSDVVLGFFLRGCFGFDFAAGAGGVASRVYHQLYP